MPPRTKHQSQRLLRLFGRNQAAVGCVRIAQPPMQPQRKADGRQIIAHRLQARAAGQHLVLGKGGGVLLLKIGKTGEQLETGIAQHGKH